MKTIIFAFAFVLAVATASNCICDKSYIPVCGSNGKTYSNRCLLDCAQRTEDPALRFKHEGVCSTPEKPQPRQLDCGCTYELRPVCGSNGVTYANPCLLRCAQKTNPSLKLRYAGECGSPTETVNRNSLCPCTKELNPVCGSNGETYANPCLLRCAQKTDAALQFFYPGNCGHPDFDCACTKELHYVCGTNGYTYANPCIFRCAKATFDSIEIAHEGKC